MRNSGRGDKQMHLPMQQLTRTSMQCSCHQAAYGQALVMQLPVQVTLQTSVS